MRLFKLLVLFGVAFLQYQAARAQDALWFPQQSDVGWGDPMEACRSAWLGLSDRHTDPVWYAFRRGRSGRIYQMDCGDPDSHFRWAYAQLVCQNGTRPTNDLELCGELQPPSSLESCPAPWSGRHPAITPMPIHIPTGSKLEHFNDFASADGRFRFERTYTTKGQHLSALGWGWRHNFERSWSVRWITSSSEQHILQLGDETVIAFVRGVSSSGPYFVPVGIVDNEYSTSSRDRRAGPIHRLYQVDLDTHTYELVYPNGRIEHFDSERQLIAIHEPGGYVQQITYPTEDLMVVEDSFGHRLELHHDRATTLLDHIVWPDGQIQRFSYRYLAPVGWPDQYRSTWARFLNVLTATHFPDPRPGEPDRTTTQGYTYGLPIYNRLMTGIVDERGIRVKRTEYVGNIAWASEGANGRMRYADPSPPQLHELQNRSLNEAVEPQDISQFRIRNPLGKIETHDFQKLSGFWRFLGVTQEASASTPQSSTMMTLRQSGDVYTDGVYTGRVDTRGTETVWERDVRGRPTRTVYGANTETPYDIETIWHPDYPLPLRVTRPGLTSTYRYNEQQFLLSVTHTDTRTNAPPRTTQYAPLAGGLLGMVDGPLPGFEDVTRFTYSAEGYLSSVTDPNGLRTEITDHDGMGRPLTVRLPGGLSATLQYSPRGWLTQVKLSDGTATRTTRFSLDEAGHVTRITLPTGGTYDYTYEGNGWITDIRTSEGGHLRFTHNNMGQVTRRLVLAGGEAAFTHTSVFDDLGRLTQSLNATGDATQYARNAAGDVTSITTADGQTWQRSLDGLGRLIAATDPEADTMGFTHDAHATLAAVQDGRSLETRYTYNGFGEVIAEESPDRGTTHYKRDAAGRVTTLTTPNDEVNLSYDGGGRLIARHYPDQPELNMDFAYDGGGRLARISDAHGETLMDYNGFGERVREQRTLGKHTYETQYRYSALGQVAEITYPSGRVVRVSHSPLGRIKAIDTRNVGDVRWSSVASDIRWAPFGPLTGYRSGNGLQTTRRLDANYRLAELQVGAGQERVLHAALSYDAAGRLDAITDLVSGADSARYTYTSDGRLAAAEGPWGGAAWTYDAVGNRSAATVAGPGGDPAQRLEYDYSETSNRLMRERDAEAGLLRRFAHRGDGDLVLTADATGGTRIYAYDAGGRLAAVIEDGATIAQYGYDAFGRRVLRRGVADDGVQYVFDGSGRPLAEHDAVTGALRVEYIWLGDLLVAQADDQGLYHVHGGHLGQPLAMTNARRDRVWRAAFAPFGAVLPRVSDVEVDLGLPGQWAEGETGLIQNWHRDYDPTLGRYLQADPLGLAAGQSLYGYAGGDPINRIDPMGLWTIKLSVEGKTGGGPIHAGGAGHFGLILGKSELGHLELRPFVQYGAGAQTGSSLDAELGLCLQCSMEDQRGESYSIFDLDVYQVGCYDLGGGYNRVAGNNEWTMSLGLGRSQQGPGVHNTIVGEDNYLSVPRQFREGAMRAGSRVHHMTTRTPGQTVDSMSGSESWVIQDFPEE